jgi:hypothetical protein
MHKTRRCPDNEDQPLIDGTSNIACRGGRQPRKSNSPGKGRVNVR